MSIQVKYVTTAGIQALDNIFDRKRFQKTNQATTLTLAPNTMYIWNQPSALKLTLPALNDNVYEEFMIRIATGSTVPTVTITPTSGTLVWKDDNFSLEANSVYDISILDNYGIIAKVG